MKPNLNFDSIQQNEIPELQRIARTIWEHSFRPFLSQAQIEYMLPMMYSVSEVEQQIQSGFSWQWIVSFGLEQASTPNPSAEHPFPSEALRVGYVSTELQDHCLYLHKLYIIPEFQRRGFATETLQMLKFRAKCANKAEIRLNVNKNNHHALQAYHKAGFTSIKEVCTDIGGGFVMDDYVMKFTIDLDRDPQ